MSVSAMCKGVGAGMMVGAIVYFCCAKKCSCRKSKLGRALKSIGAVVEDVSAAIGL